ncbi:hypothetical protein HanXRQr2_Chr08g0348231 [Helianthus annuus]|uniref:Uncharacterized protein n=1 Tax=Helianthus annuus TaxID=4232 RepID=A0A9K3IGE6_HELAN|nr:hypothetical protein HanXRQr2_Chr08g0348231 [Helianthus annuus]KAJ0902395.1 hypothetical protein HanPSC8_Chr08g0336491 [Helianthus annuus]
MICISASLLYIHHVCFSIRELTFIYYICTHNLVLKINIVVMLKLFTMRASIFYHHKSHQFLSPIY